MNIFIPTLIAVLFAEIGGRSVGLSRGRHSAPGLALLGGATAVAAFAGLALAATMSAHARALMLGLALLLTGAGQLGGAVSSPPSDSLRATMLTVWRSGTQFIAFAFAAWQSAPVGAAAGALAGAGAAMAIGPAIAPTLIVPIRRAAGTALIAFGLYALLWALRLI